MKYYIYAYFDSDSANPFYIGKGSSTRCIQHFDRKHLALKDMFHRRLRCMILQLNPPIVRVLYRNLAEDVAYQLEILLIKKYGRRDKGTGCLYNMTDGGPGQVGLIFPRRRK